MVSSRRLRVEPGIMSTVALMQGLEDQLFTLRFTSKQLAREAKRCEKEQGKEKLKVKKVSWEQLMPRGVQAVIDPSRATAAAVSAPACPNDSTQAIEQGNHEGAQIYAQVRRPGVLLFTCAITVLCRSCRMPSG
jgi:hypothetical protein